jgi:imidazolonepropionase-like amidohydrolase
MAVSVLFRNARVFDGFGPGYLETAEVFVEDGLIKEVSETPIRNSADVVANVGRRVLMPGLIDNHMHLYATGVDIIAAIRERWSFIANWGAFQLRQSLDRGFTSVRDVGGADVGLARAVQHGLFPSPRLFYGGAALSQTGGHGDFRRPWEDDDGVCGCVFNVGSQGKICGVVDGADAMRRAVREELRKGAHHIKIMGSGGVVSPSDPLDRTQFTDEEIRVAVEETGRHGTYVTAHIHPAHAARRCSELGVRCIEHGTLMDDATAAILAKRGTYVVPTLAIIFGLEEEGERLGFPPVSMEKLRAIIGQALPGLESMARAGVKLGFGTDLLGKLQVRQCNEFGLRGRVQEPLPILQSATSVNADILMQSGKLGCIKPEAHADILVVDGDPLKDIGVLGQDGRTLSAIMQAGVFHKTLL